MTNPERVIDPSTGLTKLALVRYYESIAERILPHLVDRPVSLVRAPEGITGELFFQKHPETRMPGLRVLDVQSDKDHNRSVLTLVGDETALKKGLLALFEGGWRRTGFGASDDELQVQRDYKRALQESQRAVTQ